MGQSGSPMPFASEFFPQYQPIPTAQFSLSDNGVVRVAMQVKLLLNDEINRLVKEKVEQATSEINNKFEYLKMKMKECSEL